MKDRSIHFTAQKLSEDIKHMNLYKNFYMDLQVGLINFHSYSKLGSFVCVTCV